MSEKAASTAATTAAAAAAPTRVKNCTFVTAVFDLGSREPRQERRSFEAYVGMFRRFILRVSRYHPVVVFIEPQHRQMIELLVKQANDDFNPDKDGNEDENDDDKGGGGRRFQLQIRTRAFEELPLFSRLHELETCKLPCNRAMERDTYQSAVVTMAKTGLVREVATENPYHTSHFAWMDIGIFHLLGAAEISSARWDIQDIVDHMPRKVCMLLMRAAGPESFSSGLENYYANVQGIVSATMWTGSRKHVLAFAQTFDEHVEEMIETGRLGTEEQVMGLMIARDRQRFAYWHGDYMSVLSNYVRIRADVPTILRSLTHARVHSLHDIAIDIVKRLLDSLYVPAIKIGHAEVADILFSAIISCYYVPEERDTLGKRLAYATKLLCEHVPRMRQTFDSRHGLQTVARNLAFYNLKLNQQQKPEEQLLEKKNGAAAADADAAADGAAAASAADGSTGAGGDAAIVAADDSVQEWRDFVINSTDAIPWMCIL